MGIDFTLEKNNICTMEVMTCECNYSGGPIDLTLVVK